MLSNVLRNSFSYSSLSIMESFFPTRIIVPIAKAMVLAFLHRDTSADCLEYPLDIPTHGAAFYEALPPLFARGIFCNYCREHLLQSLFKKIRHIGDGTSWHFRSYAGDAQDLLSAQAPHDAPLVVWSIFKSGIAVLEQFL